LLIRAEQSWVRQARSDPSIYREQIEDWALRIERELRQATVRYDYAKLFGDLLEEWLQSGDSLALTDKPPEMTDNQTKTLREGGLHILSVAS
jgi:hypothetical protein